LSRESLPIERRLLKGQLAVYPKPAHKQEPAAFRRTEWGGIISDALAKPGDNQPQAGTFCFAQGCLLCTREFARCPRLCARCKDAAYHLLFPFGTRRYYTASCPALLLSIV